MIKIGIEVSSRNLLCDLLENPGRYFFIREADSRASLCIQTCNSQGEDIKTHMVDALAPNGEGNVYSILEDGINDTVLERLEWKRHSCREDKYPVSSQLEQALSMMPDFMEWIISSILTNGRNLVVYPSEYI